VIECGMCGHAFTREEGVACAHGCPMSRGCGMVTCPSCGYEQPAESKVVTLVRSLFKRDRKLGEGAA
jgi:hypothetical protein